jgi:hypothetical protein
MCNIAFYLRINFLGIGGDCTSWSVCPATQERCIFFIEFIYSIYW